MGSTEWEVPADLNAHTAWVLRPWEQFNRKICQTWWNSVRGICFLPSKLPNAWKRVPIIQVWNPAVAPHGMAISSSDLYHQRDNEARTRRYFLFAFTPEHDQPKCSPSPKQRAVILLKKIDSNTVKEKSTTGNQSNSLNLLLNLSILFPSFPFLGKCIFYLCLEELTPEGHVSPRWSSRGQNKFNTNFVCFKLPES